MTEPSNSSSLSGLFHHRWAVPALAAFEAAGGAAKLITLRKTVGAGRDSFRRTLTALIEQGLVEKVSGYGHPMRPEYELTRAGRNLAPACAKLMEAVETLEVKEVALKKWSMPVVCAIGPGGGRFSGIFRALRGITPRALTQALRDLQASGLVRRRLVEGYPPHAEYGLTPRGRDLVAVLFPLAKCA